VQKSETTKVLIPRSEVEKIVERLGRDITAHYGELDRPLMVIGLLRGSFIFMADLIRAIDIPLVVDFMTVSSYGDGTVSSGDVKVVMDLDSSVEGRDVLLVEDIVDTGRTFSKVIRMMTNRNPKSLRVCTFLDKPSRRITEVNIDFCGVEIEDEFVVGYGLDYGQRYRNLPYVGILEL
jgi:hypoxanthine phosphoribosyltransferase